jgi:hypothetical protein
VSRTQEVAQQNGRLGVVEALKRARGTAFLGCVIAAIQSCQGSPNFPQLGSSKTPYPPRHGTRRLSAPSCGSGRDDCPAFLQRVLHPSAHLQTARQCLLGRTMTRIREPPRLHYHLT